MLIAGLVLCAIGLARGETNAILFSWQGAGSILYLIVFGSIVGFGSYIYALTHLPASTVTTYAYLNPIVAVSLGWLILDERLDWWVGLSTAVILTGVLLVNKSRERKVIEPKTQPERLISAVEET
jgi:drug/metabolite transporter (DMT)-like permease